MDKRTFNTFVNTIIVGTIPMCQFQPCSKPAEYISLWRNVPGCKACLVQMWGKDFDKCTEIIVPNNK